MNPSPLRSAGMQRQQIVAWPGALLVAVVVLALAGCGGSTPSTSTPTSGSNGQSTSVPGVSVGQVTRVPELEQAKYTEGLVVVSIPVTMKNKETTSKEIDANLWEVLDARQKKSGPTNGLGKEAKEKCEEWVGPGNPTRVTLGPSEEHTFHVCFRLADSTDSAKRLILSSGEEFPLQ